MKNQLLIIDGSSYIFRAFYGVRAELTNQAGAPTNAVFGFKNMMLQLLKQEDPSHCIMVFDKPGPTFRNEIYSDYKANRASAPDDLKVQFEPIYQLNTLLNIPLVWRDGVEADDVIGSLTRKFSTQIPITIISGDKDLTQLVNEKTTMLDTMSNKRYTPETVQEKFGVPPELIAQYLAVIGDSSDNIPGISGIGPKTATKLFRQFGSITGIYENLEQLKGKQKETISTSREMVDMSLRLTKIRCDLEFDDCLDDYKRKDPDVDGLLNFYREMNFRPDGFITASPDTGSIPAEPSHNDYKKLDYSRYELVTLETRLVEIRQQLLKQDCIVFDLETTSLTITKAKIVGFSFAWEGGDPIYIPVAHTEQIPQIPLETVLEILRPVFEKKELKIVAQNIKYDMMVLANYGVPIEAEIGDTMIQSYLLDANLHRHNLDDMAMRHLEHEMIKFEEVAGKGKKQIPFAEVPVSVAQQYAAEDADATFQIHQLLSPRIKAENLAALYENIELPLCRTLAQMETHGVRLDVPYLNTLCEKLRLDLDGLQQEIHAQAGETFNINSTQQLSTILFEKMGITIGRKKNKTGYSTDASVLEKIAPFEPIARNLLDYRSKNKLVNTYLDVLPSLISPKTGRIHTSYSQVVAATGRLSSSNPNLQNIPIKGEDGSKVRRAFVAEEGNLIVSADYSQIELRFLAHLSEDEGLISVFAEGGDIHTETAAGIYGIEIEQVSPEQRQAAKAINFGIIYGMGAFRLSQEIRVSNAQAKSFIEAYFAKYPKIKHYMDETIAFCQKNAFVETMFRRKRAIPDIHAKNHMVRTAAERMAINTRIQGSAADLIKIAMIDIQNTLDRERSLTKMIMQVHDELVFEVPRERVDSLIGMVKKSMENAVALKVPLVVDAGFGENWQEAH
ncbi:MAG: DNA polymerase I [Deltaproteobacteria bacterium]|nr:DNA polymerase I [Deltaproteobacteria bacterium]